MAANRYDAVHRQPHRKLGKSGARAAAGADTSTAGTACRNRAHTRHGKVGQLQLGPTLQKQQPRDAVQAQGD